VSKDLSKKLSENLPELGFGDGTVAVFELRAITDLKLRLGRHLISNFGLTLPVEAVDNRCGYTAELCRATAAS
jgi:hypothetical protein